MASPLSLLGFNPYCEAFQSVLISIQSLTISSCNVGNINQPHAISIFQGTSLLIGFLALTFVLKSAKIKLEVTLFIDSSQNLFPLKVEVW